MRIRIGFQLVSKEMEFEIAEEDANLVQEKVNNSLAEGKTIWFEDRKGSKICILTEKIAYVEIGGDISERRLGFTGE